MRPGCLRRSSAVEAGDHFRRRRIINQSQTAVVRHVGDDVRPLRQIPPPNALAASPKDFPPPTYPFVARLATNVQLDRVNAPPACKITPPRAPPPPPG